MPSTFFDFFWASANVKASPKLTPILPRYEPASADTLPKFITVKTRPTPKQAK